MMANFDRFKSSLGRTFALRSFNLYETEINEHFWSFKVISEHSRFQAAQQKSTSPTYSTAQLFHATGPDARRIPATVTAWLEAREELENWLRLSALVSAAAYHETYLRQAIRSALMADPLVRIGKSKSIDGTVLLKKGAEIPYKHEESLITRGEWSSRSANFEKIFGKPDAEAFPVAELEKIRKIRNDYAHGFGRNLDTPEPSEIILDRAKRLRQDKFIAFVGLLSKSAKSIDKFILKNFINEFELVHAYHKWTKNQQHRDSRKTEIRNFQKYIHSDLGISKSKEFCDGLISYYDETN